MTMLMVAIASVNLVSCGDDDDDKNNQNQNDNGRVEGYDYYTFNANGTGYSEEWNYYGEELRRDDADNFVYTYQNNRLTITEEDGDVEQYVVLSLTATQTQWREIHDSDIKTLVREQAK